MTWGTVLVLVIIAALVVAVVIKMIRDKKNGKSSCGGDCSSCGGACGCCGTSAISGDDSAEKKK